MAMTSNGSTDVLAGDPPSPPLRSARSSKFPLIARHGSASNNDGGSRMLALMGANPAAVVANAMATIEQQVKIMRKAGAVKTAAILESVIGSMRDVGASELGDLAQGNTPDAGDSMPPGVGQQSQGPAPAMGAPAGMMPPPPPG